MKYAIAASVLFASLAIAVPMNKRDIDIETVWTTTTVWVDPTGSPNAAFFEVPSSVSSSSSSSSSSAVPSSSSAAAPSSSVYVAPVPAYTPPPAAPVDPTPPAAPPAPAAAAPAPPPAAPAPAAAPAGATYSGDITFYEVADGAAGSCGTTATDNDAVVALSVSMMANGANSNGNPKCGKTVLLTYNGVTTPAKVYDTCEGCADQDLDLSPALFKIVAPNGDGRVHGVSWSFAS
jgi:hypothetical protein